MRLRSLTATLILLLAPALAAEPPPRPPVAPRKPHVETWHGERRADDYYWLRNKTSKEVLGYLKAEAAYADAIMKPTEALQQRLYDEMLGRIKQDDDTPPYPHRGYLYYSRTVTGKEHPLLCRKRADGTAPEEVMLDLNALREKDKLPFASLGAYDVSVDGNLLAYALDTTGFREHTLYVKDLRTGALLAERVPKVASVAFAADGRTLFYTVQDKAKRPYRLYRHVLGEPVDKDALVYEEKDERFVLGAGRTRSDAFIIVESGSHTTSEVRYLDARDPTGAPKLVAARTPEHQYDVDHGGDVFYIRTNSGGRNFRVVQAPVADPRPENWKELLPHRPQVMVEYVIPFAGHLVVGEREDGLPHLRVVDLAKGAQHRIALPEPVYALFPGENAEFATTTLRFRYTSFITPMSFFDYDMATKKRTLVKEQPVLGGYDRTRYRVERVQALASDGVPVPISLVTSKASPRDGSAPMLLEGYGAYGAPYPVYFDSRIVSLLDRGVAVAVAHVRGGGELGKRWHDAGRMFNKRNSFSDFIAAAEHLVREKYTASDRLAIQGASAGGLLIGAVLNMRPELFRVAILGVPFVDVISTMLDESLPLTVGEFEEWGNPKLRDQYHYMMSYSPYDNLEKKPYPTVLVRSSLNDSQVMYWEPAKWVARLRTLKTDKNPLLFKIDLDHAGHGGKSGRYERLRETAYDYAFLLTQLGVEK